MKGNPIPHGSLNTEITVNPMIGYNMSISHTKEWSWKYILLFGGLIFFWAIENFILQASAFSVPPVSPGIPTFTRPYASFSTSSPRQSFSLYSTGSG
jgi:hypothetical protein